MNVLVSCTLEESKKIEGLEEIKGLDKIMLNILSENDSEGDILKKELPENTSCITFIGKDKPINIDKCKYSVFAEFSLQEVDELKVKRVYEDTMITPLVRLEDGYSDMRVVQGFCREYPNIRFIGGDLLLLDDIRVGRFEKSKDNLPIALCGIYDDFLEVSYKDLDILPDLLKKYKKVLGKSSEKSKKKSSLNKKSSGKTVVKKQSKRKVAFNSLFSGESGGEEF